MSIGPPLRQAWATPAASSWTTDQPVPSSRGTAATSASSISAIIGTVTSTHSVITARAPGLSSRLSGSFQRCGQQSEQGGADPVVEVGDPGQVGEQVVAVEAQQRQQLLHHLQGLGRDQQQQGVPPGGVPPAEGEHHDQGVEVQAAQVGADPAAASEPVAVGDVGVERGPHQVEAGSDDAGFGAAVAGGRGVAELVEPAGEHGHREHQQQQLGTLEGVVGGRGQALLEEDPPGHGQEGEGHDRHQRPGGTGTGTGRSAGAWPAGW